MKIAEIDDVDSDPAKHRQPGWIKVRCAAIANHLVELQMEVSRDDLEAGQRFVDVVVGVGQHRLLRCVSSVGAQIVVHRHALHRAGRRVIQRVVLHLLACRVHAPLPNLI